MSHFAAAQCDTTGILLELQATTNLNGLLIGDDKCIKKAVVMSPLVLSNDTLSFTGGGSGTVTSFSSGSLSPLFTTSVATATTTPALSFSLSNAGANTWFGNNTGGSTTPSYNSSAALTKTDDTNVTATLGGSPANALLNATSITLGWTGTLAVPRGGIGVGTITGLMQGNGTSAVTGITNSSTGGQVLRVTGASTYAWGALDLSDADAITGDLPLSNLTQGAARTVLGVAGNATADRADIQGTTDQVLRVNTAGTALGFGTVATGGLADDAVTYAKLQNISTNNRILGRITAGAGNAEELTPANMQTILAYLDGALTNPRIPYASDANTLTDNANLVWLNGSQEIMVGGGATLDARFSHRATANITGDSKFSNGDNNVSGTYEMRLANTRNVSNTGNSKLTLQTGGTAAGDPFIYLNVPGGGNVSIGIDNSDGDKIKFSPGAAAPGANANNGLVITNTATPFVGINTDNPGHALDVAGSARAVNLRNTLAAPTVGTLGTGLGTGPTIDLVDGGNNGFIIWFTTGTAPAANGNLFRVTYANPFAVYSFPVWSADNNNAATDYNKFTRSGASPAWFDWKANGTLTANTQYRFIFNVMGL